MQLDFGRPERIFGLGSDGVVGVGGDTVVVCLEGNLHAFERLVAAVICLVVLFREEDVGNIDHAARDVDRL